MSRASTTLLALGLATTATSCRDREHDTVAWTRSANAARIAHDSAWLASAPPCAPPAPLDTAGWRNPVAGRAELALRLPPGFADDTVGYRPIHGGWRWRRGGATVAVMYGHWGPESFGIASAARCRAVLGGRPAVVLAAAESVGVRLTVWLQVSGESQPPRPLIEAASTDTADLRLLWTVARTLRVTPSGR